jgi:hypothetical protein
MIRELGFASDLGEFAKGITAVAAPVFGTFLLCRKVRSKSRHDGQADHGEVGKLIEGIEAQQ